MPSLIINSPFNNNDNNGGVNFTFKIKFNVCQACVTWAEVGDDDAAVNYVDDNYESYHMYDSKLCGAAAQYKQDCGWGCKKMAKVQSSGNYHNVQKQWGGFEKFCLFFWSFAGEYLYERVDQHLLCVQSTYISFTITHHTYICVYNYFQNHTAVALVWVVLKQRRMMSREDAIVEEAAMNGIGLKKRHVFPIALGIIFFILFSMFMVWKKLTWILLMGTNIGLFGHFVYLRRKAKRAGGGGEGYIKDAGLEIS